MRLTAKLTGIYLVFSLLNVSENHSAAAIAASVVAEGGMDEILQ